MQDISDHAHALLAVLASIDPGLVTIAQPDDEDNDQTDDGERMMHVDVTQHTACEVECWSVQEYSFIS